MPATRWCPPEWPFSLSHERFALSFRPLNCASTTDFVFQVLSVFLDATRLVVASGIRSNIYSGLIQVLGLKILTVAELALVELVDVARLVGNS